MDLTIVAQTLTVTASTSWAVALASLLPMGAMLLKYVGAPVAIKFLLDILRAVPAHSCLYCGVSRVGWVCLSDGRHCPESVSSPGY